MRKILHYELAVATKDRPRFFQVITLVLFSFSITVILVSFLARFAETGQEKQAYKPVKPSSYAGLVAAPASRLLPLKK